MITIDTAWLKANPLPVHADGTDKNARGRVLVAGGGALVPGALRLTGEAAFRAGAGKVQLATVGSAAIALGVALPEAASVALPSDAEGEIARAAMPILRKAMEHCDTFVFGPGISDRGRAEELVKALLDDPRDDLTILLDAAAVACAGCFDSVLRAHDGRIVMTPHHGEMAALTGLEAETIADDPVGAAGDAARRFGAVIVLKAGETIIAAPDGTILHYPGGGVGLGTGGSGDVLAGVIGGLLARGTSPLVAAAWGVWLHGEAGRTLADRVGPIGFLARELLAEIPGLMVRD